MFKKVFFICFIFLYLAAFCQEEIIEGNIKYSETLAKKEAFKGVEYKIKRDIFKEYLHDKNRKENIDLLKKGIIEQNDRYLCPFYINETIFSYAVVYKNNPLYAFYYNLLGSLIKVDISEDKSNYPKRNISYSRYGNLIGIVFETDEEEQFIYDKNGKLIARWVNKDMYDKEDNFPKFLKIKRGKFD